MISVSKILFLTQMFFFAWGLAIFPESGDFKTGFCLSRSGPIWLESVFYCIYNTYFQTGKRWPNWALRDPCNSSQPCWPCKFLSTWKHQSGSVCNWPSASHCSCPKWLYLWYCSLENKICHIQLCAVGGLYRDYSDTRVGVRPLKGEVNLQPILVVCSNGGDSYRKQKSNRPTESGDHSQHHSTHLLYPRLFWKLNTPRCAPVSMPHFQIASLFFFLYYSLFPLLVGCWGTLGKGFTCP